MNYTDYELDLNSLLGKNSNTDIDEVRRSSAAASRAVADARDAARAALAQAQAKSEQENAQRANSRLASFLADGPSLLGA